MMLKAFVVPGLPQTLLSPDANPGYKKIRQGLDLIAEEIENLNPDILLIYSTMWPSILGHQIQGRENCEWTLVDEEFHELGSIPYKFSMDKEFANLCAQKAKDRGLLARVVDYHGFPIDTGSVVALKLLNPKNKYKACIFSSNIYADRAETVVLAKAAADSVKEQNKKAVAIIVSTLSNRLHAKFIKPQEDKIHSLKDQEWNLKILEFLEKGRLEDVSQLSRQIQKEVRVKKVNNFKPFWWLSTVMGSGNCYRGEVYAYESIYGTGSAVVGLTPAATAAKDLEFDEDSPDVYAGERNVLSSNQDFSSQNQDPGQELEPEGK